MPYQSKKLKKIPIVKQRHPLPLRKPPRLEGKVENVGIKPVRKKKKS